MLHHIPMTTPREVFHRLSASRKARENLWENARFILARVPLDRAETKKVLPPGMRPTEPATGTLFIVNYMKTAFTVPYREAALLIHVRTLFGRGVHCCWMTVDDDTALIYGRELLGYPKKMADFDFQEDGDTLRATVTRRGIQVLSMEAKRGPAQSPPPPVFHIRTFNAGALGQGFVLNPVWMFRPEEVIHESYEAEVSVSLLPSAFDPLDRLVSGAPLDGRMVVMDIPSTPHAFLLPAGFTGPGWWVNTFALRYR